MLCGGKAQSTLMPATLLDHVTVDMRIYGEESLSGRGRVQILCKRV